jgi:hypothetical protein
MTSLRPIVLPLIYILAWRCHAWFFAIDQDGDGMLSAEELRTHTLSDSFTDLIQLLYRQRALE